MSLEALGKRTIFVEGLSCCGKTTVLQALDMPDVTPVYKIWPPLTTPPTIDFFLERDEEKLLRAKNIPTGIVMVDRSYLSTLTFYSVLEEQRRISTHPVYKWYIDRMWDKTLYRPDEYLFIDVDPETSLARSKHSRVID